MPVSYQCLFIRELQFQLFKQEDFYILLNPYAVFLASNDTDKKVIGIAYIPHASEILIHIKGGRQFLHFPMVEFYCTAKGAKGLPKRSLDHKTVVRMPMEVMRKKLLEYGAMQITVKNGKDGFDVRIIDACIFLSLKPVMIEFACMHFALAVLVLHSEDFIPRISARKYGNPPHAPIYAVMMIWKF